MRMTENKHSAAYRRKMRKRRRNIQIAVKAGIAVLAAVLLILAGTQITKAVKSHIDTKPASDEALPVKVVENPPDYEVDLLTVNEYSRSGQAIEPVKGVVIHYTANPGTSAKQNRDYFEGLKDSHETSASSHFVIGLEGELVQCIPCNEIAYASNDRNKDTIAIECCIADDTGKFNDATYQTLVHLTAWLCGRYQLPMQDVIRHYDITGKMCPKYYVSNEDAWEKFKEDVAAYIEENGVKTDHTQVQE